MSSTVAPNPGHPHANEVFLRAPLYVNAIDMGASSAVTIPIPAGTPYVRLAGNLDFYVRWGDTGVSTGTASNGSGSELVPLTAGGIFRNIGSSNGTTAISVMSTAASHLTAMWWAP